MDSGPGDAFDSGELHGTKYLFAIRLAFVQYVDELTSNELC